jgi:hypothetical protein
LDGGGETARRLEDVALALRNTQASAETRPVDIPRDVSVADPTEARFLLYVGLFDALVDRALSETSSDEERETQLRRALATAMSAESVLKFERHERQSRADQNELMARMRSREIQMTERWMLPRLREDIDAYRRRIDGLRRVLQEGAR